MPRRWVKHENLYQQQPRLCPPKFMCRRNHLQQRRCPRLLQPQNPPVHGSAGDFQSVLLASIRLPEKEFAHHVHLGCIHLQQARHLARGAILVDTAAHRGRPAALSARWGGTRPGEGGARAPWRQEAPTCRARASRACSTASQGRIRTTGRRLAPTARRRRISPMPSSRRASSAMQATSASSQEWQTLCRVQLGGTQLLGP